MGVREPWVADPRGLDPETGRLIGWDYARHGLALPPQASGAVLEGHAAGRTHFGTRARGCDRYTRKWLQLRHNAWLRNRVVDDSVTPALIKRIDVRFCPVSRIELTHATGSGTDWSIDRVVNCGGYAQGNLAVMSAQANRAKSTLTLDTITHLLNSGVEGHNGLNRIELARLFCLCIMAETRVDTSQVIAPLRVVPPPGLLIANGHVLLQLYCSLSAMGTHVISDDARVRAASPGKRAKRAFDELIAVLARRIAFHRRKWTPGHGSRWWAVEDAWGEPAVYAGYKSWVGALGGEGTMSVTREVRRLEPALHRYDDRLLAGWSLDTNGYRRPGWEVA